MRIMFSFIKYAFILVVLVADGLVDANKEVQLTCNGPIVQGGTITFDAVALENRHPAKGPFQFFWSDNVKPPHERDIKQDDPKDHWSIKYDETYPVGDYEMKLLVKTCVLEIICYEFGTATLEFRITETLNGGIEIRQGNETRLDKYVSSEELTKHKINLSATDQDFVKNATRILTYWFVDCVYYGFSESFDFNFNFTKPGEEHVVEALVTVDFTPPPPTTTVAPTTTTHKPNVTTTTTTKPTTTKITTTTKKPNVTKSVIKRSVDLVTNKTSIMHHVNGTLKPYNDEVFPFVCNGTKIATSSKLTYGYFYRKVKVEAPITKVNTSGNFWLQQGTIFRMKVMCQTTPNMQFCINTYPGSHNSTQNETCYSYRKLDNCDFEIERYYPNTHTLVLIIKNDVSKVVTPIKVTIYNVQTQPQLSIVVVPVAFSLVAVVMIIFGVAYYIQNRSHFLVEVADFNFGQQYNDMEYKTFRERLRDSLSEAFTRDAGPSGSSSEPSVWPPGGRKYGAMS
ncbi:unnamed protein product [Brassicogethes aeneus]|uniref:Uncharacterized protein n=1 Tax=Brassicogethes aeneus TaxID=1431903 RepID=A0A9P0ANP7_BRAAE|nr:unnamed protein product [Brassicogethes aeneus]